MNIEYGWKFSTADFSVQAAGKQNAKGSVMLVRAPEERARWHAMSEADKEDENGPPLYVTGEGLTFEDAIVNANLKAAHAKPISA